LFNSVLDTVGGGRIPFDSVYRRVFAGICAALWNSELFRSFYAELGGEATMENVVDRLQFLSATRCDITTELEFIASYLSDFLCRRDALKVLPFSMI
jgi:hypothetical protein